MQQTILMVEDNPDILNINASALELRGYRVIRAVTLEEARAAYRTEAPDLLVLDILLPDGSGLDFCTEVRENSGVPILFLSALDKNGDIVAGLSLGGDDYLPKPYDLDVLIARVGALLRRAGRAAVQPQSITRGPLRLDLTASRAYLDGRDILLTQKEYAILLMLVRNEGQQMSAEKLYEAAWGMPANGDVRAVWTQMSRLRAKLEIGPDASFDIVKKYGEGYRFEMK